MESEKATSKSVSPRLHAFAVANVDKLFASASIEMKHPDTHGRNEVEGIRRLGTVMRDPDDGLFIPVMLTVVEYRQYGKKIYTVETVDIGKYKNPAGQLADSPTNGDTQAPITEFVSKIAKLAEEINQSDVSKVVDENGEPKVVYHSTDADFTQFDRARLGENTDINASDDAARADGEAWLLVQRERIARKALSKQNNRGLRKCREPIRDYVR